jgi:streptogramin lyase
VKNTSTVRSFVAWLRLSLVAAGTIVVLASCGPGALQVSSPQVASRATNVGAGRSSALPTIEEYRITAKNMKNALDLAFDASGTLWVNSIYAYLGKRSPKGHITAQRLRVQKDPYGYASAHNFATDAQQHVFFSTYYGEVIGIIQADDKIVEFQPPNQYVWTAGMVVTHGHLWVVGLGSFQGELMEYTLAGRLLKRISLPGYYCYPGALAASKDGTLWVGYSGNCPAIVRVSETGSITEFPIVAGFGVWAEVLGPDGNIWFTANDTVSSGDYVGRITPSGDITEYPLPYAALGIVLGPTGDWYVTLPYMGEIVEMTMSGNIVNTFTIPGAIHGSSPNYQLGNIRMGPDRNLWFVEGQRNQIGELQFGSQARKGRTVWP